MGKEAFISDSISSSRIVSHGKIASLANGFNLPNKEGFTIYARPKEGVTIDAPDIVLSVKCMTDENPSEVPVRLNEWNSLYLESIAPDNDILDSVDLYWGAGFYITKGKGKYYTEPTAVSTRYSGEAQALVTAGSGTGTIKYRLSDGEWSDDVPTATNAGVYEVEYKMEGDDLHEPVDAKKLRCAIAEKFVNDPTIELTPSSFTYNGSACVPTVVVKDGQRVIPASEYTVEITNNVNAGTANVVIHDNIAGDYEVLGSTTFNIAKADVTYTAPTAKSNLTYNGSSQAIVNAGTASSGGTLQYKVGDSDWGSTVPSATNAGSYVVQWRIVGDVNHNDVAASNINVSVAKVTPTVVAPTAKGGLVYDGTAQTLAVVGSTDWGTLQYSLDNSNWGTSVPTVENAGSYTLYYRVVGDSNIKDVAAASIACSVAKATRTISFTSAPSSVDVGDTVEVAAAVSAGGGNISYFSSNENVATVDDNVVTGVSDGTCNIIASVAANDNYEGATAQYQITAGSLDYSAQYLTFVPVEDSTFGFSKAGLSYSLDNGSTWTALEANGTTPTVTAGSKILWKGTPTINEGIGTFSSSKEFDVQGNIMSLLFGDNFEGKTSLSGKNYAFISLFQQAKVRNAEDLILPATTLAISCYNSMFYKCTSLATAPALPATTLRGNCYYCMFFSCTSLAVAPALTAKTLETNCYSGMFKKCTSLATAPELPATTLVAQCYNEMFSGCTSLTTAPELPATTLTSSCYDCMFEGCTSLNYVKMLATNISASNCLNAWLYNVSASGTFVKAEGVTIPSGTSGIPSGWTVEEYSPYKNSYLTFVPVEDSTFGFSKAGLSYSLDNGSTWTALEANGTTPTVTAGSKILWKNNTTLTPSSSDGIGTFSSSKNFDVQCNIMSLYYGDNFVGQTSLSGKGYAFEALFRNGKIRNANNLILPATTLATDCYNSMFRECTSLTTTPELPATTLATDCYNSMFRECTSLTTAPELPATTLAQYCYNNMFYGCTSLTTAPELPATTLDVQCYFNMFRECTSLTTSPELPATTLTTNCYSNMFNGCTHLNYVKMSATDISATGCLTNWLNNVSASGTFVKAEGVDIPSGASGIPEGWTIKIYSDKPWKNLISLGNTAFGGISTPEEGGNYIFSMNRSNSKTRKAVLSTVNPYNFTWAEYDGGENSMNSVELIAANVYPVIIPRSYIGKTLTQTIKNPNGTYGRWGLSFKGITKNGYTTSQNTYDSGWQQFSTTTLSVEITSNMFQGQDYIALGTTFAPFNDNKSFIAQQFEVMDTLEITIE